MKKMLLSLLFVISIPNIITPAPFQNNTIVAVRVNSSGNAGVAVFLDEYSTNGILQQTISLPTATSGSNRGIVLSGNASSEGFITLSTDLNYLVLAGYDGNQGLGQATPGSAAPTTINRVIARIDQTGNYSCTTALTDPTGTMRTAASTDGSNFWFTTSSRGVGYATLGSTTSTQLTTAPLNCRIANIVNGQFYFSSASNPNYGVLTLGGLPTSSGQTASMIAGWGSATHSTYGFSISPDGNTMYMADDGLQTNGGGIQKWTKSGGVWSQAYTLVSTPTFYGMRAVLVDWSGTYPVIYATDNEASNSIYKCTDMGVGSTLTLLVTAPASNAFRGLTFTSAAPSLLATLPSLNGISYIAGSGPSFDTVYTLSGSHLLPNTGGTITVTAPTDYEVSVTLGTGYSGSLSIAYPSGGILSPTRVYVRLKSGKSVNSYNGELITNSGGGASVNVTCNGYVTAPGLQFSDDFSYTAGSYLANQGGWVAHVNIGSNPQPVTSPGLTYSGYLGSGVGNAVSLNQGYNGGEDCNHQITGFTSGSVYASAMVNVTGATLPGEYFLHLGNNGTYFYTARVFVRPDGSGFDFGLSKISKSTAIGPDTPVWTSSSFPYIFGQTYLIVVKYTFYTGSSTDDQVQLFVNPVIGAAEPAALLTATGGGSTPDIPFISGVYMRQGTPSNNPPSVIVDGIRVGDSWSSITPPSPPALVATLQTLNNISYIAGSGPSFDTVYTLSGSSLNGSSITVTPSSNYEITLTLGGTYQTTPLIIPYTAPTLPPTRVYVRLIKNLPVNSSYTGTITNSGGGASTQTVTLNGYVKAPGLQFSDDFSYTAGSYLANQGGWIAHVNIGSNPQPVTSPGLTYSGYLGSGVGNAVSLNQGYNGGEDCNHQITGFTSGSVYASAMVNVTGATLPGEYFLHLGNNGTYLYTARVFVRPDGSGFDFGLSKESKSTDIGPDTPVWTSSSSPYIFGQTYLIVVKYTFNTTNSTDDQVQLFVNPVIGAAEPAALLTATGGGSTPDMPFISGVYIRQGRPANNPPSVIVDGIRVGDSWDSIIPLSASQNPCPGIPTINYAGQIYNTVQIGNQCWLKENLNVGTMINGTSDQTNNSTIEKYCYYNNLQYCLSFGGLYQWDEAMQYVTTAGTQGICPSGWHIPTSAEYQTLATTVGNDGNSLKAVDQGTGAGVGTNTSGFSALLAGLRNINDIDRFNSLGLLAYFWSSTEDNASQPSLVGLDFDDNLVRFPTAGIYQKGYGFSIRCLNGVGAQGLTLNLTALLEAPFNGTVMENDVNPLTVTVELRDASTYALVESKTGDLSPAGVGTFNFTIAANGTPYYITVSSSNTLEVQSATTQSFTAGVLNYDFTTSLAQVYTDGGGFDPMVLKEGKWCIFSGDVNQDGAIDAFDLSPTDNDNVSGGTPGVASGLPTDVTCDGGVDAFDLSVIDNNNTRGVYTQLPFTPQGKKVLHDAKQRVKIMSAPRKNNQ